KAETTTLEIGSSSLGDVSARAEQENGVAVRPGADDRGCAQRTVAPPWFSPTTVPSTYFIFSAHGRPTASYPPPGGDGMTSRIGRSGRARGMWQLRAQR